MGIVIEISAHDPTHLHASVRQVGLVMHRHTVDMHRPTLDPLGHVQALLVVPPPYARAQADVRVVGDPDGVLDVLGADHDERRPECLLMVDVVRRVDTIDDDRGVRHFVVFRSACDALDQIGSLILHSSGSEWSLYNGNHANLTLEVASATRVCSLSTPALLAIRMRSRPLNSPATQHGVSARVQFRSILPTR